MLYTKELYIKGTTPLYHFKYGVVPGENNPQIAMNDLLSRETYEGLRVTEVKPRFIRFLKYDALGFDEFNDLTYKELSQKISLNFLLDEKPRVLDDEISKASLEENGHLKVSRIYGEKKSEESLDRKWTGIFVDFDQIKVQIQMKLAPEDGEEIFKKVCDAFAQFISFYSFGRRSGKGYGSFTVVGRDGKRNCITESNSEIMITDKQINNIQENVIINSYEGYVSVENYITELKKPGHCEKIMNLSNESINCKYYVHALLGSTIESEYNCAEEEDEDAKVRFEDLFDTEKVDKIIAPYRLKFTENNTKMKNDNRKIQIIYKKDINEHFNQYLDCAKFKDEFERAVELLSKNLPKLLTMVPLGKAKNNN